MAVLVLARAPASRMGIGTDITAGPGISTVLFEGIALTNLHDRGTILSNT